jgi:hypothetical protein
MRRYYLQRYGKPKDLMAFWMRRGLYDDALKYLLATRLGGREFIIILDQALEENKYGGT